jgi:hypothetical protein
LDKRPGQDEVIRLIKIAQLLIQSQDKEPESDEELEEKAVKNTDEAD